MTPADASRALLQKTQIDPKSWRIGKTMVFMNNKAAKALASVQRERLSHWAPLVEFLEVRRRTFERQWQICFWWKCCL